ncbi:unnamed protein product [Moneuplotes crassus]|uniref:Uncharacterized protein n=1 Tax=Euplotes crassus TaxID=5936 RepID=A0AAD1U6B1_EUPCR|nr:unnamed protein product [Moneuplotes crassus]
METLNLKGLKIKGGQEIPEISSRGTIFCSNTDIRKYKQEMEKRNQSEASNSLEKKTEDSNSEEIKTTRSLYRYRKDVCYKFFLRKMKGYYKQQFIEASSFISSENNRFKRAESLKSSMLKYCKLRGFLDKSPQFPFLLSSFLFPKYSQDIINLMITQSNNSETREKLNALKKIIELLKNIFQNYSEIKFRKAILIPEIRYLMRNFIKGVQQGKIEVSSIVKGDCEHDKAYIQKIFQTMEEGINAQLEIGRNRNQDSR